MLALSQRAGVTTAGLRNLSGFPVIATGNNRYTLKILEASLNESEDDALGLMAKSMRNRLTSSLA